MKLSLSWIRDYVDLPADLDIKKLAYELTMDTVEVEGIENLADRFENMVVGVIEEVLPHPNADKLRVCRVNIGEDVKEIVCGGINLAAGMKVAVACPGAMVRWHGEGEPVMIKNSKLRGVASFGMICASDEIGLGELFPASQEAEIVDLSAFDAAAGTPLAKALGLDDQILEIDNKSMTNRPDLWGHYGIAREIAALYGLPLKKIEPFVWEGSPEGSPETAAACEAKAFAGQTGAFEEAQPAADAKQPFYIEIADPDRCPRYIGVELEGVYVKPATFEMQTRIWRVGMRPINALVDITNYVMLATGNPTHAFDADNISGHIVVRKAKAGEKLLLLNDKDLTLTDDDLVITDAEGPVALAGVMGGAKDSILPKTQRVILEVANFESTGIRRTALRYDNRTEASSRYEKAVDPERCDQAVSMAMAYFKELYPEMKVTGYCDKYPKKLQRAEIDVDLDWLAQRLGMNLSDEVIRAKLEILGFEVSIEGRKMHVTAPTWRSTGDISIKDDVMEEVARMYGYDNFQPTPITTTFDHAI
ncbi:MAG: phenylalanine--tRNA ligase subunit beta, partial [bacterium]